MLSDVREVSPYLLQRYNAIYEAVLASGADGLTVADVARQQGLRKSRYIAGLLDQMVVAGWLRREYVIGRYRHFRYYVSEGQ